jgi:hypothetical protein
MRHVDNLADRFPGEVTVLPFGSVIGLVIPRHTWFDWSPSIRYVIDQAAADWFLSNHGDFCRIFDRNRWDDVVHLVQEAERDWRGAVLEAWMLWSDQPTPPAAAVDKAIADRQGDSALSA